MASDEVLNARKRLIVRSHGGPLDRGTVDRELFDQYEAAVRTDEASRHHAEGGRAIASATSRSEESAEGSPIGSVADGEWSVEDHRTNVLSGMNTHPDVMSMDEARSILAAFESAVRADERERNEKSAAGGTS